MDKIQHKILLIEDEPDISILVSTCLKVKGIEVTPAYNGKEGIELAKSNHYDLIITDVSMPEMDGYQVVKTLKLDSDTKDIPVIFFSAHVREDEINKGLDLGAIGYLRKPFDPFTIYDSVMKYINLE